MSNKKARNIKILKYAAFARTFISSNSSLLMQLQLSYQELKFTEITVFMEECFSCIMPNFTANVKAVKR